MVKRNNNNNKNNVDVCRVAEGLKETKKIRIRVDVQERRNKKRTKKKC